MHADERGRRLPFRVVLGMVSLIGVSGTASAVAFDTSEPSVGPGVIADTARVVQAGETLSGVAFELGSVQTDRGACVTLRIGSSGDPAMTCAAIPPGREITANMAVRGEDVIVAPVTSRRVARIEVEPVSKPAGGGSIESSDRPLVAHTQPLAGEMRIGVVVARRDPAAGFELVRAPDPVPVQVQVNAYDDAGLIVDSTLVPSAAPRIGGIHE